MAKVIKGKRIAKKLQNKFMRTIRERKKKIPLDVRLYVHFQSEWYDINIRSVGENRNWTIREVRIAEKYAREKTDEICRIVEQWRKDGVPKKSKAHNEKEKLKNLAVIRSVR